MPLPRMEYIPLNLTPLPSHRSGTLLDLIRQRGDIEAERAGRSGEMWANTIAGLGQLAGNVITQRAERKQAKEDEGLRERMLQTIFATAKSPEDVAMGLARFPAPPQERKAIFDMWMAAQPKPAAAPEPFTLSPGAKRFGPTGEMIAEVPPLEKPPAAPVMGSPEWLAAKEAEARIGARYRAPSAEDRTSYQAKDVLNDQGQPVLANFDSRTGRYIDPASGQPIRNPRPVPAAEALKDARKFKQAGPILDSVAELTERINTQQGIIAKMSGGAAKVAAQANYNDDVAEYQALIMGFTPLVARALGHTGVLTEQDVVSVRALFPKPGDSKTLRDRKIARIQSIVGQLESESKPGAISEDAGGWMNIGGIRIRKKKK